MVFVIVMQQFILIIMALEVWGNKFYPTNFAVYIILRYFLMVMTYYMFASDYMSIA